MSLVRPFGYREKRIKEIIKSLVPKKEHFYSTDQCYCFDSKKIPSVPYELDAKQKAGICGTAFDYLARFSIARIVDHNRNTVLEHLTAENLLTHKSFLLKGNDSYIQDLKNRYNDLLTPINNYILGAPIDEDILITSSIILSKMEMISRGNDFSASVSYLFENDSELDCITTELKKMLRSFEKTFLPLIHKDSIVVYNPVFGIGSHMIGGADADIYIDGVIYDFKTSIKNGWNGGDVAQVIGYFLLDKISKQINDDLDDLLEYPVKKVALYKVRYSEIAFFDVSNLSQSSVDEAAKEICILYLTENLFRFIPLSKAEEHIKRLGIPLTMDELHRYCSSMSSQEIEWYINDGDEISEENKKTLTKILEKRKILRKYFDGIDVFCFLQEMLTLEKERLRG